MKRIALAISFVVTLISAVCACSSEGVKADGQTTASAGSPAVGTSATSNAPSSSSPAKAPLYFPIGVGNSWTYEATLLTGATTQTVSVGSVTPDGGGWQVQLTQTNHSVAGTVPDERLTEVNAVSSSGALTVPAFGAANPANSNSPVYLTGQVTYPSLADFDAGKGSSAVVTGKVGSSSFSANVSITPMGKSQVQVPAGSFEARHLRVAIDETIAGLAGHITQTKDFYYAENVGLVQWSADFLGQVYSAKLTAFTAK